MTRLDEVLQKHSGVLVMKFRPKVSPWTFRRRRLRRLHRKMAFVGGMNIIGDMEISGLNLPCFDYAVSVEGPVVQDIYNSCRRLWLRVA